jgi:hypothetical protein
LILDLESVSTTRGGSLDLGLESVLKTVTQKDKKKRDKLYIQKGRT